jgi:hypothetical protein
LRAYGAVLGALQDGRHCEGEGHSLSGRYAIGGVPFDWDIEELEDIT